MFVSQCRGPGGEVSVDRTVGLGNSIRICRPFWTQFSNVHLNGFLATQQLREPGGPRKVQRRKKRRECPANIAGVAFDRFGVRAQRLRYMRRGGDFTAPHPTENMWAQTDREWGRRAPHGSTIYIGGDFTAPHPTEDRQAQADREW